MSAAVAKPSAAGTDASTKKEIQTIDRIPPVIKVRVDQVLAFVKQFQAQVTALVKDPQFKVVSISACGGAITLGATGGCVGATTGTLVGGAVGVVPALFTFGLSIPTCAIAGGAVGGATGAAAGAGTGFIGGGISGKVAYAYRVEIKQNTVFVKAKVVEISSDATAKARDKKQKAQAAIMNCVRTIQTKTIEAKDQARKKVSDFSTETRKVVCSPEFKVTAASAAGGCVVGGTTGFATGATFGAAIGVVPALFTLGLSIPVGAVIGGGIGATTGGSVGFGAGGAVGYGAYTKRKEIQDTASSVKNYLVGKAKDASSAVNDVKTKLIGSTGSTI